MISLRPYQQEAVDATMAWVRTCLDPCLIEAVTAAGKSLIAAAIIREIVKLSGKKVLCLAPSQELVSQNAEKYRLYGERCSIYCAGLGVKDMRHDAVFGTPRSVENAIARFGSQFAAIIVDEAHYAITGGVKRIIEKMRAKNPKLRVIGMTATPFTTNNGYIFKHWPDGTKNDESVSIDPFFHTCVYRVTGHDLLRQGFITPFNVCDHADGYDTSNLKKKSNGKWDEKTVNQVFVGRGRKTSAIVADIVERSRWRDGIMIFAATVQHAEEVMESLPPSISALVTGDTPKIERERILNETKGKKIRYLVNVSTLTTGVDITHIDVIAVLRATESPGLFLQILGRGLRLDPDKKDCILLDYAENVERHFPHGDIFEPEIKAKKKTESEPMEVKCPMCSHTNIFGARKNDEGFGIDGEGYFTDLAGQRIEVAEGQPLPAHYGRRCQGEVLIAGHHTQCGHKWSYKECPECGGENDIAARYCSSCRGELVDPNERLQEIAAQIASDPYRLRIAPVTGWFAVEHTSSSGIPMIKVRYDVGEHPHHLYDYIAPEHNSHWMRKRAADWCQAVFGEALPDNQAIIDSFSDATRPTTIAFAKKRGSKFFEVRGIE